MNIGARILKLERKQPAFHNQFANLSDEELAIRLIDIAAECLNMPGLDTAERAKCLSNIEIIRDQIRMAPGYYRDQAAVVEHLRARGFWNE